MEKEQAEAKGLLVLHSFGWVTVALGDTDILAHAAHAGKLYNLLHVVQVVVYTHGSATLSVKVTSTVGQQKVVRMALSATAAGYAGKG
jgi:hypothetical protein